MNGRLQTNEGIDLARRALDLMEEHKVAPTPQNYAVWVAYVSDSIPELSETLQTAVDKGGPIDDELCDELYDRHFTFKRIQDAVLDTGGAMSRELGAVVKTLEAAERDTAAYGEALAGASGQLGDATDTVTFKRMVEGLVSATARMQRRSRELERRLQETSVEVNQLRGNLEKVREEAMTDALTGLANRKRFDESMRKARRDSDLQGDDFCLVLCDIDHFKRFNDTWGHQTGDQIIRFVAACLSRFAKDTHIVARYGGEEFAIVMPKTTVADAAMIAEKIRATVESKRLLRKSTNEDLGHITVSMGVSQHISGEAVEGLIERADTNLYKSKQTGRNRVTVDSAEDDTGVAAA
ncbi:MAG TPA: GGDEF domain-containing protein [Oceanicaulis sp.]|uniref:GGDEF domain-containing protein n=1 Tax=Glycocaulis albus TaxID=1382801 RepID=UPI000ED05E69|nr:GGDEF domain-containing protein [Glycocaulis albus]MBV5258415.1 GGDEF domain-containing protein [Synechococcus moorigangaii CMS01]HCY54367.1 GGDEF domain-containing protein [Oceanicaulis sp.]